MSGRGLLIAGVLLALAGPAQAQTKAQVQQGIDRAVRYLKQTQQADGSWRYSRSYQQGATALALYAMLMAGVPANDPAIRSGIRFILSQPLSATYSVSLVSLALAEADATKYKREITRCARWLEGAHLGSGMWSYRTMGGHRHLRRTGDNSNTQFAVLGLWAAERAGVTVDPAVWRAIRDHFRRTQSGDGSWGYRPGRGNSMSMTLAGIGSLLIANGRLRKPGRG